MNTAQKIRPELPSIEAEYLSHHSSLENSAATTATQTDAQRSLVSVLTAATPNRLAKQYSFVDGELVKQSGGALVRGHYEKRTLDNPHALAALVASLAPNQALAFGTAAPESAPICSRSAAANGELTRTRDNFDWPDGAGWLLIDYDPAPGATPMTPDDLRAALCEAAPALAAASAVTGASGSAHIYHRDTGEQLKGAGGLRVYLLVADARDIPRAGAVLFDRLWLAGYGFFVVSASGALLERTLVDGAVWQPERLDFASGASCHAPLEQRRPTPERVNADAAALDTAAALPDLTPAERDTLVEIKDHSREAVADDQRQARHEWVDARMAEWEQRNHNDLAARSDDQREEQREQAREKFRYAVTKGRLFGDFELIHHSGAVVSIGELLDKPDKWHGERFADPLEPNYGGDRRIAWLNLRSGGKPFIWSHAHGGRRYHLVRASATIQFAAGEMPRIVREADALMAQTGEVYQRGGELVRLVDGGELYHVTGPWLRTHLETIAHWQKFDKRNREWQQTDAPGELHARLLHNRGDWSTPELTGVVRGPILRPDGSLLAQPGYDPQTGLLLVADHPDGWPSIPANPTAAQIRQAVRTLWEPFALYPFACDLSRAVHLAALLTAVQRPMLETAPAFGYNAPKAGSGKTKLAKAATWLGGAEPVESPWSTEAEEQRKRLMASLMAGPTGLLLDNISGPMQSDTLCAILTSSWFKDRKLGVSEEISAPTRVFVTASGNNLRLVGDLSRRVLVATIDHGIESPERLAFAFDPVARVKERWLQYRAVALTILRGFLAAGAPCGGAGAMGTYEQWDALIRQSVVWLRDTGLAPFGLADPADAVSANYEADPDTQKLRALLAAWHGRMGGKAVRVGELISDANGDGARGPWAPSENRGALLEALQEIAGEPERINRRRLGRWVEGRAGRILDGLCIEDAGSGSGTRRWRIKPVR